MTELPEGLERIDWRVTTWDGNRRAHLEQWRRLPLERIIAALEEMEGAVEEWSRMGRPREGGRSS